MQHYDMLVIGSGPAGQRAAIQAAKQGKTVGLIERKHRIGGAGLQTGTIPSKALREIAYSTTMGASHGMRSAHPHISRQHDFLTESIRKKNAIIDKQEEVILNQLMRNGVTLIAGEAGFQDAHTLCVKTLHGDDKLLHADYIILATGSRPRRPDDVPFDKKRVLDSTSILNMQHLPKTLTIIGGGVIACEFATIYASLGVAVSLVDRSALVLPFLCNDISETLQTAMLTMGIRFYLQQRVVSISCEGDRVFTRTDQATLDSDCLLFALGRVPNVEGLGLDELVLDGRSIASCPRGWLEVNEHFQSNIPHIYAVGDLIGAPSLAATGMEQGRIASIHACNAQTNITAKHLPMAIYTIPEVAWVGKTTAELDAEGIDYVTGNSVYRETARGQIIGDQNGLLKIQVDTASRKLLGVHIVGEIASELIHIGQLVMNLEGTVDDLVEHVFNYPTLAECYKTAALDCSNQLQSLQTSSQMQNR